MFSPSQTATMLLIAPSTLRKYANLYSEHLSESARRKQRKYTDSDIATLKRVCQLRSEGVSLDQVSDKLGIVDITKPQDSLLLIPEISQAFEDLRAVIANMQDQNTAQVERIDELEARLEWLSTPWYKRIGKQLPE